MIDIQLATEATYTHQTLNNFSLAELKGLTWHQIRTQTSHKDTLYWRMNAGSSFFAFLAICFASESTLGERFCRDEDTKTTLIQIQKTLASLEEKISKYPLYKSGK